MRRRKSPGFSGQEPISWQDIDAFIRRSGVRLAPWEIGVIEGVDDVYLNHGPRAPVTQPEGQTVVVAAAATDGAGVKSVLGSIGARRVSKKKKKGG